MCYIIKKCQQILEVEQDGFWGDITEDHYLQFWGIEHFELNEFECHCGCGSKRIDIRLVKILDDIRNHYNSPIIISSGVRCPSWNKRVGGVSNSWHLNYHNKASDIKVQGVSSSELNRYAQVLVEQGVLRYAYAIDSEYVHIDIGYIM